MDIKRLTIHMAEGELGDRVEKMVEELVELRAERDRLVEELADRERLDENLENQAQLLDLVQDAFILHDLESGAISFWNPAAEDLYGWRKEEAVGQTADTLLRTRFPRPLAAIEEQLLREGRWDGELVQTRRDGSSIVVSSRWALQFDAAGRPEAILEINTDITEQKRAAEALAELAAIVQSSHDAIVGLNARGQITSWNVAAERLLGYGLADAIGRPLEGMVPPESLDERRVIDRVMAGEDVPPFESLRRHRDGHLVDVSVTASPILDSLGKVVGTSTVLRDISEHKRMQAALRESEQRFRAIFENAAIGIALCDPAGRALSCNAALKRVLGYDAEAFLAMPLAAFIHPDDVAQGLEKFEQLVAWQIDSFRLEQRLLHRDGHVVWAAVTVTLVRGARGEPRFVVAMIDDITDRRHLEVERERLQAERIGILEQADEVKTQFLGILSHELRTPINAIMGFGSILDDGLAGDLNERQHLYLSKILNGSESLLGLVNDLLDLSRIQAGKFHISPAPMHFASVVETVLDHLNLAAEEKQQRLEVDLPAMLPGLEADENRLIQVLGNLVGNAIKYTGRGGTIRLRAENLGDRLRCEVTDNGIGIASEDLHRLFQRFSQLDMSSTRAAGGAGLGLSIAKALVEAHGGRIGVESVPGHGSTFWFELPFPGFLPLA